MMFPDQRMFETLAQRVGELFLANRMTLVTAESCTGGWVSQCLTAIAGSSEWFDRGFVTYSNQSKQEMLDVPVETIMEHGAVSQQTAAAMSQGALCHSSADWAVAITGIAGPGGGSVDKPVGTVCFAWAEREGSVMVETCHFRGDREAVRAQSVAHALSRLIENIRPLKC